MSKTLCFNSFQLCNVLYLHPQLSLPLSIIISIYFSSNSCTASPLNISETSAPYCDNNFLSLQYILPSLSISILFISLSLLPLTLYLLSLCILSITITLCIPLYPRNISLLLPTSMLQYAPSLLWPPQPYTICSNTLCCVISSPPHSNIISQTRSDMFDLIHLLQYNLFALIQYTHIFSLWSDLIQSDLIWSLLFDTLTLIRSNTI